MDLFRSMNISATGLSAQRIRMNIIADNLANVNTTRTDDGGPYRRKHVLFAPAREMTFQNMLRTASTTGASASADGVRVTGIIEDQMPFTTAYDPGHPDADAAGMVKLPNVNAMTEMVNMLSAARTYESNITALQIAKEMAEKSLEIGR